MAILLPVSTMELLTFYLMFSDISHYHDKGFTWGEVSGTGGHANTNSVNTFIPVQRANVTAVHVNVEHTHFISHSAFSFLIFF